MSFAFFSLKGKSDYSISNHFMNPIKMVAHIDIEARIPGVTAANSSLIQWRQNNNCIFQIIMLTPVTTPTRV